MLIDPETSPGSQLYPGTLRLPQGTHYQYTPRGHFLILSVERAGEGEIAAIKTGLGHFGLFFQDQVLFLISQFGSGPCRAAHYNWWFNPPDLRPDIGVALAIDQPRIDLQTILVDANSGVIQVSRRYRIGPPFSQCMLAQIRAQISAEFDPWRHLDTVAEVLARYPDCREMLFGAVAACAFGMALPVSKNTKKGPATTLV